MRNIDGVFGEILKNGGNNIYLLFCIDMSSSSIREINIYILNTLCYTIHFDENGDCFIDTHNFNKPISNIGIVGNKYLLQNKLLNINTLMSFMYYGTDVTIPDTLVREVYNKVKVQIRKYKIDKIK